MPRQFPYRRIGEEPANELEHYVQCLDCGTWLDCRELGEVIEHEETCEGRGRRAPESRAQQGRRGDMRFDLARVLVVVGLYGMLGLAVALFGR